MVRPRLTPFPSNLSWRRRISSSARMKYRGEVMSPWTTPRLIGNISDLTVLPPGADTDVYADADEYTARNMALNLLLAPAFLSVSSMNL